MTLQGHCSQRNARPAAASTAEVVFDEHYVKVGPENPTQRQKDEALSVYDLWLRCVTDKP